MNTIELVKDYLLSDIVIGGKRTLSTVISYEEEEYLLFINSSMRMAWVVYNHHNTLPLVLIRERVKKLGCCIQEVPSIKDVRQFYKEWLNSDNLTCHEIVEKCMLSKRCDVKSFSRSELV